MSFAEYFKVRLVSLIHDACYRHWVLKTRKILRPTICIHGVNSHYKVKNSKFAYKYFRAVIV